MCCFDTSVTSGLSGGHLPQAAMMGVCLWMCDGVINCMPVVCIRSPTKMHISSIWLYIGKQDGWCVVFAL